MDHNTLLDMATDLGYELAMSGAETFRIEESISRILQSYGVEAEVFAIPNYLIVSITTDSGKPITRMRRIGHHGNDLDSVEKFSGLSRALCNRRPEPSEGLKWLDYVRSQRVHYSPAALFLGYFLGAAGFSLFFGGSWRDAVASGLIGIVLKFLDRTIRRREVTPFFPALLCSVLGGLLAALSVGCGLGENVDMISIGNIMLLISGAAFFNSLRDIITGDMMAGILRLCEAVVLAVFIAAGVATAMLLTGVGV